MKKRQQVTASERRWLARDLFPLGGRLGEAPAWPQPALDPSGGRLCRDAAGCRQAVQAPQSPEMGDLSPSCDRRRPIHIPCGYRPNSLIAGGTTNAKRNIEHAGRHLWSSVSAVSLGGGCISTRASSSEDCCRVSQRRGAENALGRRDGKECQHPLSFSSHQSPGQTCKEVPGEAGQLLLQEGLRSSCNCLCSKSRTRNFQCQADAKSEDRKIGLGDGLGAQGASENEQGNKDKHLSGSAFQALLSRRHRPLSYTQPRRMPGLEPPATCLLRAASSHSPKPAAEMPFPGQDFKQEK